MGERKLKVRAHVFVTGSVQGVFFRYETLAMAMQRKVTGWVKNLRDGRVEAIFEGEKEAVEAMIDFCRRGPPGAVVTGVNIVWKEPTGEFSQFQIYY